VSGVSFWWLDSLKVLCEEPRVWSVRGFWYFSAAAEVAKECCNCCGHLRGGV
jgi:hypothetical protein